MESSTTTEPSIGKAFVLGLLRLSLIAGGALALSYVLGEFLVRHGSSLRFVNDMLTNWPASHDWMFSVAVGLAAALLGVLFLLVLGVALALVVAVILEAGGKEIFPSGY